MADKKVAPVIQSVIHRFLCPWYKMRAKTVFRDLSCLPAGSSLESELLTRLDQSMHLIILASFQAKNSRGMEMEARHWFSRQRSGEVLIIVTEGTYNSWGDIRDNLLPAAARKYLADEPLWASLQDRRQEILTNPESAELRGILIEDLKQILLRFYPGRDWGQLRGEERKQRRRAIRILVATSLLFLALTTAAIWFAWVAETATKTARAATLDAKRQLGRAQWILAGQARDQDHDPVRSALLFAEAAVSFEVAKEPASKKNALAAAMNSPGTKHLLTTFTHEKRVVGAVWNKDESRVLTWSLDGTARLWSSGANGELLQTFQHDSPLGGACFFNDDKNVMLWGESRDVKTWTIGRTEKEPLDRLGHDDNVAGVGISSDGKHIATWSRGYDRTYFWPSLRGSVQLWTLDKDRIKLKGKVAHSGSIVGATFLAGGTRLMTWEENGPAKIWAVNADSNEPLHVLDTGKAALRLLSDNGILLSWEMPDPRNYRPYAASGPRIWDATSERVSITPIMGEQAIYAGVVLNEDRTRGLSWGRDTSWKSIYPPPIRPEDNVRVWRLDNNRRYDLLQTDLPHDDKVLGAMFGAASSEILTWCADGKVTLWSTYPWFERPQKKRLWRHPARILDVAWLKDKGRLLTRSADNTARLWSNTQGWDKEPLQTFHHNGEIHGASLNKDESRVLTWSEDGTARVWEILKKSFDEPVNRFRGVNDVKGTSFDRQRGRILAWSAGGTVHLWDIERAGSAPVSSFPHGGDVRGARFSPDGNRVFTWGDDHAIKIWVTEGSPSKPLHTLTFGSLVHGVAVSNDRRRLVTWGSLGQADGSHGMLWDLTNPETSRRSFGKKPINRATFSKDGTRILFAEGDLTFGGLPHELAPTMLMGSVRLFDLQKPNAEPVRIADTRASVVSAAFSKDEHRVLAWTADGSVHVWKSSAQGWEPSDVFKHPKKILNTAFNRDESRVVTSCEDGAVRLWRVGIRATEPETILTHDHPMVTAVFTKDEQRVLTWSASSIDALSSGSAKIWALNQGRPEILFHQKMATTRVKGAVFSDDESRLLVWDDEGKVQLWGVSEGRAEAMQSFRHERLNYGAFTRDEDKVLTVRDDIKLWKMQEPGPTSATEAVALIEARTGCMLNGNHTLKVLTAEEVSERRRRLRVSP